MDFFDITYEEFLKIRVDEAREGGLAVRTVGQYQYMIRCEPR